MARFNLKPIALALAALAAGAAQAQQSPQEQQLPEVKVTDPRLRDPGSYVSKEAGIGILGERSLIETPYSVNVITRELMFDQQADHLVEVMKNDPSTSIANLPVGFMTIRGFTLGTDGALYDGMPGHVGLTDGRGYMEGFERIEVLKGAGSFLYGMSGSASLGGTLNYIPKRAPDTPVRQITGSYAMRSVLGVHADIGNRFGAGKQFGYRVNVAYKDGEQATDRYDWTHKVATFAFDWRATPDLVISANFEAADNNLPRLQPFFVLGAGVNVPRPPDASRNIAQPWDNFRTQTRNAQLRADWQIAKDWSLTAQLVNATNYRPAVKNARFGMVLNNAGDVMQFGDQGIYDVDSLSGQVRVSGKLNTGGLRHELTFGASGSDQKQRGSAGAALGVFMTNLYNPVAAPEPLDANRIDGTTQKMNYSSLFATDILSFGGPWSVLLGARSAKMGVEDFNVVTGASTGKTTVSRVTPTGALMYRPTRSSMLYASASEGLEQGGTAPGGTANANERLGPMVTKQFELGAKMDLGGVTLATALFDMRKPNEITDPATNIYGQSGKQRHRGAEFTATGRATPNLTLVAGAMVLDATATGTGNPASESKDPVGVSRWTGNLWASYRIAGVAGLSVNGGAFAASGQYVDAANTQHTSAWTRLDAGLRYDAKLGGYKAAYLVTIENLADKDYWTSAQQGILSLSNPRTLKLSARVDL